MVIPTIIPIIRLLCDVYLISYASVADGYFISASAVFQQRKKQEEGERRRRYMRVGQPGQTDGQEKGKREYGRSGFGRR